MKHFVFLLSLLVFFSCSKDEWGESKFADKHAHFTFKSVSSVAPLIGALNNPGEWCSVALEPSGARYMFSRAADKQPTYWNITAQVSERTHAWIAGLIVGTPSIPEPGASASVVTCYDLVCPTCYRIPSDRQLSLATDGHAQCPSCKSRYNLNNQGLLVAGPEGAADRLFRYRVSYMPSSNVLLVSN